MDEDIRQIDRDRSKLVIAEGWRVGHQEWQLMRMGSLWGCDGCRTLWIYDKAVSCTLWMGEFCAIWITWHIVYEFGEGNGTPLQYSCLENPMDGGAWWAAVHGITKSRTRLSDFTFTFHFYALEKEIAVHSSVLAWRIPGTGEPGGLPSMGSHRVGHNWSDLVTAAEAA